jgi:S-adenosylmethionine/arginine decarboxylase-like enzyme
MTTRGLHTLLNYSNFFVQRKNLENAFTTIRLASRNILTNNHLRIVDQAGKIFIDSNISPEGFTWMYLLDESHMSCHAYTDQTRGKMAIDLFTCTRDPTNHINAVNQLNTFLLDNYFCNLDSRTDIPRFT